jgi:putative lipoprotein
MQHKGMRARHGSFRGSFWGGGARAVALVAGIGLLMSANATAADRLVGRAWLAEDIQGGGVIDNVQSKVVFEAGGKVTGSGGCNRLFGMAKIAGASLAFGSIGTTRMACAPAVMHQESKFLSALAATRTFRFDGPYLKFYDGAGVERIRFTELRQ